MYIMKADGKQVVDTAFVQRFLIATKPDATLVLASYEVGDMTPPVTLGRYADDKEAGQVLGQIFNALVGGQVGFTMPESYLQFPEHRKCDARTKRRGGS